MGEGVIYRCPECGFEKEISLGIGFMFPKEYQKTVKKIQDGKYGKVWKELFASVPDAAINADLNLYVCTSCGSFKVEPVLSIYKPMEDKPSPGEQFAFEDPNPKINYVMPNELPGRYKLVKTYVHKCSRCGKRMRRYANGDLLKCPKCMKGIMELVDFFMWD